MVLSGLLKTVGAGRRSPTTIEIFRTARRYRDEGRFEEAAQLVARGLDQDPKSLVGHLLAGSLYAAFRETDRARAEFERVLALDALHPRALLGLARIALEEGDTAACVGFLRRALERYPDFPEAQALHDVVTATTEVVESRAPSPAVHVDRLRPPADSRELLLLRPDATVLVVQPRGARTDELATRTTRVARLATAMLARAGLGALRHAVIDDTAEMTVLRSDPTLVLALTFAREVDAAAGLVHLDRVWTNAVHAVGAGG